MATNFAAVTNHAFIPVGTIKHSVFSSLDGWIVCDGKSIGKAGSGANFTGDLYRELYDLIWNLSGLTTTAGHPFRISSAKGASTQADWDALKTIVIDFESNELFIRQKKASRNLGSFLPDTTKKNGLTLSGGPFVNDATHNHGSGSFQANIGWWNSPGGEPVGNDPDSVYRKSYGTIGPTSMQRQGTAGRDSPDNVLIDATEVSGSTSNATLSTGTPSLGGGNDETAPKNLAANYFIKY